MLIAIRRELLKCVNAATLIRNCVTLTEKWHLPLLYDIPLIQNIVAYVLFVSSSHLIMTMLVSNDRDSSANTKQKALRISIDR